MRYLINGSRVFANIYTVVDEIYEYDGDGGYSGPLNDMLFEDYLAKEYGPSVVVAGLRFSVGKALKRLDGLEYERHQARYIGDLRKEFVSQLESMSVGETVRVGFFNIEVVPGDYGLEL